MLVEVFRQGLLARLQRHDLHTWRESRCFQVFCFSLKLLGKRFKLLILVLQLVLAVFNRNPQPRGNEEGRTKNAKGRGEWG